MYATRWELDLLCIYKDTHTGNIEFLTNAQIENNVIKLYLASYLWLAFGFYKGTRDSLSSGL
jgi:hypothetical protein